MEPRRASWWGGLWLLLILVALQGRVFAGAPQAPPMPRHGDLVFQRSGGRLSELIAGVTNSCYTHCGIVVHQRGEVLVLEAVGPVKFTPWPEWRRRGLGGAFTLARLQRPIQEQMIAAAKRYLGRPYDDLFELGGHNIYCSELIYRACMDGAHVQLAPPQKLRELNWKPWEARVRSLRGGALALDERVITPVQLLRSPLVRVVYRGL